MDAVPSSSKAANKRVPKSIAVPLAVEKVKAVQPVCRLHLKAIPACGSVSPARMAAKRSGRRGRHFGAGEGGAPVRARGSRDDEINVSVHEIKTCQLAGQG